MRKLLTLILFAFSSSVFCQTVPASNYQELQYRSIGPFRASRTVGAVGIPTKPNVFFVGVNNGGVWKTDDYGRTWNPIFDQAPTGSVGDIAVAPSDHSILYIGSGEGLHRPDLGVGDGVFKSTDGGKSWNYLGLEDIQQIGRIIVHPSDPNRVIVAGLGHPYGANEMRGVFRTKDGGKSWEKTLYINHNTGAIQVEFDPNNPEIIFADMWEHREGPWENASFSGPNSGLYKSMDGGSTWRNVKTGLPGAEQGLGRIGFCIAPSNSKRMYATVDATVNGGLYRSDDAGESWKLISSDGRIFGRGDDFAEVKVHPKNPDIIFSANVASYKSIDGGLTWTSLKGAPGGDDYHRIWINPLQPETMIFAADQGATITVNGGKTWSSWLNQPTAQIYHVATDNQFPYWVYGGQQESGAIGTASRGNGGQISMRDWMGISADEYAYVAPDPKDPNIIYGGRVTRFNKKTGQVQNVAPEAVRSGQYRMLRTLPLLFHPADASTLLFATNVLWKTTTEGQSWEIISPDLTRKQPAVPESIGDFRTDQLNSMPQRGVIYAVSASSLDKNVIWAGTDDGLVHVTMDGGKSWKDVTPPAMTSWDKVTQIDAGHFDKQTAYISVNAIRKDDMNPYVYCTHDGGTTWKKISNGMHKMGPVNVVREDQKQAGLLFAGTEREIYFSNDDGANWQSLRMNMPATSIRDFVIHENDLVVGTHGRSIWILDNISHLRELAKLNTADPAYLFQPVQATRVRYNMFADTPLPPEEPAGDNAPDGAILDFVLNKKASHVSLEIWTTDGKLVRRYTNSDKPSYIDSTSLPHPTYWIRPEQMLSAEAGHHRFVWDLRYTEPRGAARQFSIAAVYRNTPSGPQGPYVHPGSYTVKLTVDGKTFERFIDVRLDPRVTISENDLRLQSDYSMECYTAYLQLQDLREGIDIRLEDKNKKLSKLQQQSLISLRGQGTPENPDFLYGSATVKAIESETIVGLQEKFLHILVLFQNADAKPTHAMIDGLGKLKEVQEGIKKRLTLLKLK